MEALVDSCLVVIGSDCIVQYFITTLMLIKAF